MSAAILKKVRGRRAIWVAAVAALAGIGLAVPASAAVPPEVIIADTFATRTATGAANIFFDFAVPAGSWTAEATLTGRNNTAVASGLACTLLIISESSTNNSRTIASLGPNGQLASLAAVTARTVGTSGTVRLSCNATTTSNISVFNVSIIATRVNSLTRVNLG